MNRITMDNAPDVLDEAIAAIIQYVKEALSENKKNTFHSKYKCCDGTSVTIDISLEN